jgi:hypothetical protein
VKKKVFFLTPLGLPTIFARACEKLADAVSEYYMIYICAKWLEFIGGKMDNWND